MKLPWEAPSTMTWEHPVEQRSFPTSAWRSKNSYRDHQACSSKMLSGCAAEVGSSVCTEWLLYPVSHGGSRRELLSWVER